MVDPGETLVFHYHIFKNAGTSVDEMLKENFGDRWGEAEFDTPAADTNVEDVTDYLEAHPELLAFSSHTAYLPIPQLANRYVFPIIFIRHPVDRIKSAYIFERTQEADTFGAQLAKEEDFAGYVRKLIRHPVNRQARNFQTYRLAFNEPESAGSELERALSVVKTFPFVGLVDAYEQSLKKLEEVIKALVPSFRPVSHRLNVTRNPCDPLEIKLEEIKGEIGTSLYEEVCDANADDLLLYDSLTERY